MNLGKSIGRNIRQFDFANELGEEVVNAVHRFIWQKEELYRTAYLVLSPIEIVIRDKYETRQMYL